MEENRSVYALKKVNKPQSFCEEIKNLKGVVDARVDEENMTLEYAIDEWTSDYDVFTQIMTIADGYGCEFDFDCETDGGAESTAEAKQTADVEQKKKNDDEEFISDEDDELEEKKGEDKKKKRKVLSERVQRIVELSVALVFFVLALFFKDTVQLVLLAISFAVAGYDVLYEAIVKIMAKKFINEELLLSLAFFAAILLGKPADGVGAVLLYSLSAFALKTGMEIISDKSYVYDMPEKCRKVLSADKAVKTPTEEICVGDTLFFKKGEQCVFDCRVKASVDVIGFDGESRSVGENGCVWAGEHFEGRAFIVVTKPAGEGEYDKRNERAKRVIRSKSRFQKFVAEKSKIYLPCLLILYLALAFLPPLAFDSYQTGLMRWGYTAAVMCALTSSLLACGANAIALFATLIPAKKFGVMPADYDDSARLCNTDEIYIDRESAMVDGEEMKSDLRGASLELASLDKKAVLVTSLPDKEVVEICKERCIREYYAGKTDGAKTEIFDNALKSGKAIVIGEDMLKKYGLTKENGVVIAYSDEKSEYTADVTANGGAACIPFIVKLAKRTVKLCKTTVVLCLVVKAILAILALCGVASLWWVMLADTVVGIASCACALLNSRSFN